MMSPKAQFSKPENMRRTDTLVVNIPPPYSLQDTSQLTEPEKRRVVRPLPPAPRQDSTAPTRRVPRRRASGGSFVNVNGAAAPAKKRQVFFVSNPGPHDSPISPKSPKLPHPPPPRALPINIIPPTPLPPRTPGLVRSKTQPAPFLVDSPTTDLSSPEITTPIPWIRTPRMHRRFGGSVGSIPADVLADLRKLGDTLPAPVESQSPVSDDDEEGLDEEEGETWEIHTATGVARRRTRISLQWVQALGTDRWIAEGYSDILQAL
ncbi:hypothetical protein C8F04DRAFT_1108666 [Mycena alexandri]|uniref:Uncharacterized protein n=1 Tax=Mycena alexandri TaxID=1745969 RepID=A0AAD6SQ40_9AGAR|nr:hypothetical protein C8F04DRAFT_1108666 [Mycena alexandri]